MKMTEQEGITAVREALKSLDSTAVLCARTAISFSPRAQGLYHREYRLKNAEKITAYQKEYHKKNQKRYNAYQAEYRKNNRERVTEMSMEWAKANKEKVAASVLDWQRRNADKMAANTKRWLSKPGVREKILAYRREWYYKNKKKS